MKNKACENVNEQYHSPYECDICIKVLEEESLINCKYELIKFLEELEPKYTLQQQSQSILEAQYQFKPLFKCMKDQLSNPTDHWVEIDGKKFLYTQTIKDVLDYLQSQG